MADDVLIRVDGVSKKFCRSLKRSLWYGVQDTVADLFGKMVPPTAFAARNSGRSTMCRSSCDAGNASASSAQRRRQDHAPENAQRYRQADRGRIEIRGRVGALISLGAGFNPILTGRENVYINGAVLGLSRRKSTPNTMRSSISRSRRSSSIHRHRTTALECR